MAMPEWLTQTLTVAALGVVGWFMRSLRNDIDRIKYQLARNYVTHRQLRGLRTDLRNTIASINHLQVALAQQFKFKPFIVTPDPASEYDQGEEIEHDGE
ncbi:MAG TPA: hypothetical protein VLC46_20300 [Thermoanaerobaculia bacterium]|nr:hypothetical protein [Thermoanaerobaculia bacterium]